MEDMVMLVLGRQAGESIHIDGRIKIKILKLKGNQVRIGIDAPGDVSIVRSELDDWYELSSDSSSLSDSQSLLQMTHP
ncbi:MAG: carbon storage regulator [Aeoliella sp.]